MRTTTTKIGLFFISPFLTNRSYKHQTAKHSRANNTDIKSGCISIGYNFFKISIVLANRHCVRKFISTYLGTNHLPHPSHNFVYYSTFYWNWVLSSHQTNSFVHNSILAPLVLMKPNYNDCKTRKLTMMEINFKLHLNIISSLFGSRRVETLCGSENLIFLSLQYIFAARITAYLICTCVSISENTTPVGYYHKQGHPPLLWQLGHSKLNMVSVDKMCYRATYGGYRLGYRERREMFYFLICHVSLMKYNEMELQPYE